MSMVSLIICLAQAAFTGLSYRVWRVLTTDPRVKCYVIEGLCQCNKTDGSNIDNVPFRCKWIFKLFLGTTPKE